MGLEPPGEWFYGSGPRIMGTPFAAFARGMQMKCHKNCNSAAARAATSMLQLPLLLQREKKWGAM